MRWVCQAALQVGVCVRELVLVCMDVSKCGACAGERACLEYLGWVLVLDAQHTIAYLVLWHQLAPVVQAIPHSLRQMRAGSTYNCSLSTAR